MKSSRVLLPVLSLTIACSTWIFPAWAADEAAFANQKSRLSICVFDNLTSALSEGLNTTGLRREIKIASNERSVEDFFSTLESRFGAIPPRDPVRAGMANVTSTDYLQDIVLPKTRSGVNRIAKIRIRSYGERPEDSNMSPKFRGLYKRYSKLEFKIDHPTEDQVVIKPTIVMAKTDIKSVTDRDFFLKNPKAVSEILDRTKNLRDPKGKLLNDPKVVDEMFNSMKKMHEELAKNGETLGQRINIQYERQSYKIGLEDRTKNPPVPVDIQITVDRNIEYRSASGEKTLPSPYRPNARVVELKIPLAYAKLSDTELERTLPDLVFVRNAFARLKPNSAIPTGDGKSGSFGSIAQEIEDALTGK